MSTISIAPERMAQLEQYAQRSGQNAATALDDVLASALEWEQQDYKVAVEGNRPGYEDFLAGRSRSFEEAFEELRVKHGSISGHAIVRVRLP